MASRAQQIRDLKIELDADARKLEAGFERARRSTMRLEDQLRKADLAAAQLDKQLADEAQRAADKRAQQVDRLGQSMVAFGAATVAGLALATKAAIDWESAWAGVTKTVDGSPEQMAALEAELRGLATTLPAAHAEIAAVAEAAGQLGVQRAAVAAFTKTMIDLSETTNVTAEEAATSIAQLGNVLGLDLKNDVDNFGAALVELGNAGASTEADILSMAQRIGGAGATVGLSAQDVLGFASALSSVGIEAEAGGSAISRVMVDIASAAATGGEELDTFARVAGMSADEFARSFDQDPARAIQAFIEGLGRLNASGENVFATLDELGLSEIRVRDALMRLASAEGIVADNLDRSASAWDENRALVEEAEKRYETTEAKIQIAKNTLVDLAIQIGSVVLPAVAAFVEAGADVLRWFTDLPGPVKTAATVLGTVLGAATALGGAMLLLAPRIAAAQGLMASLAMTAPRTASALSAVGKAAGIAGVLFTVSQALGAIIKAGDSGTRSMSDVTEAMLDMGKGGEAAEAALDGVFSSLNNNLIIGGEGVNSFADALDRVFDPSALQRYNDIANEVITLGFGSGSKELDNARESIKNIDQALADLVGGGNADQAADAWAVMVSQAEASGHSVEELREQFPLYVEALKGAENATRIAAESTTPMQDALSDLAVRFGLTGEDARDAAQEIVDSWADSAAQFVSVTDAYDTALSAKEESERNAAQATADATADQSDSWEDFRGDVTLTVDEYLDELERMVLNQENWRNNMVTLTGRVSDEMLGYLASLGPEGADLVALYAQMTDEELQEAESLWRHSTDEGVQGIVDELTNGGPILRQIAAQHGEDVANNVRDYMIKNKVGVAEAAFALGVEIDKNIPDTHNTQVTVTPPPPELIAATLKKIRDHFSGITVPLTIGQPGYGVLGGSGGGGPGGGAVSGGWRTPLSSGTYRVGSPFGMRNGRMHTGQDLPARTGTPIFAARAGRVSRAATLSGSYGNHVFVDHGGGWQTRYAHMSARFVRAGQAVGSGHRLGQVGSTGNSSGPHLHFEVRSGGRALNPRSYVRFARGGPIEGPGGPRDDRIPILASNGEFMQQEAAVRHYGRDFMHALNDRRVPKFWEGGGVGSVASTTPVIPSSLGSPTVTLDPAALAAALDGTSLTLTANGHQIDAVIDARVGEHDRQTVRRVQAGVRR
jgi:TP901 family phage tail tape measure protein